MSLLVRWVAGAARASHDHARMSGVPADVAAMLKADLADARQAWLDAANDSTERRVREQTELLQVRNHVGRQLDFSALRHIFSAWLALAGDHPKLIQAVLRHSSITLTMDTYGHRFPVQEAVAIALLPRLFGEGTLDRWPSIPPSSDDDRRRRM